MHHFPSVSTRFSINRPSGRGFGECGIISDMAKSSPFNDVPKKRLSRKTAKNVGAKPGTVRRVMRAIDIVAGEMAADHPAHFSHFMATWRTAAVNADALAEALMAHPRLLIPKEAMELMLMPYSLEALVIYHPLAGVLTYAEELEFVETAKALANAWNKLFVTIAARPKAAAGDLARLRQAVEHLNTRVADIYQGAAHAKPDPKWMSAYDIAQKSFARIAEGLAS